MRPPFHPNPDSVHCLQAALQMCLEAAEPGSIWPIHVLDALTGHRHGEESWTHGAYLALRFSRARVLVFDTFPYDRFVIEPEATIRDLFPMKVAEHLLQSGSLAHGIELARAVLEHGVPGEHQVGAPEMADIDRLVAQEYALLATVDGGALHGASSSVGHTVVVWASDAREVTLHDPGAGEGGRPDWRVDRDTFLAAWSYLGVDRRELVAIGR